MDNKTIIKLKGNAKIQHNDTPVTINGTISAPARFLEVRKDEVNLLKTYCLASTTLGTLKLFANEQSVENLYTVSGKISEGKLLLDIGINQGKMYSPEKLAQTFRMLRSIFVSKAEHLAITTVLRNLKATVNQQIEENKDDLGNKSSIYRQIVESNMPESFSLVLPLLEGEKPTKIEVNVILEAEHGEIKCYLESVQGKELIDKLKEKLVIDEINKIEKHVLVIYH